MDKELKPCPFCGGKAEYFEERIYFVPFRNVPWKGVRCTNCECVIISTDKKKCQNDMMEIWNKRVPQVQMNQYGKNSKCIGYVQNLTL